MKSIITYSGKGGVGKTTITYCLYKAYQDLGIKVCVLDMDLNTPSFHLLDNSDSVISNHELAGIFLSEAAINAFLREAKKKITKLKPDILLIDSPPSITGIHFSLIEKLEISGILLVSQPTELSRSDVERTVPFFESKGLPVMGIVENMSSGEGLIYQYPKLLAVKKVDKLDSKLLYKTYDAEFKELAVSINEMNLNQVSINNAKKIAFDENINWKDVKSLIGVKENEDGEYKFIKKNASIKDIRFVNLQTYEKVHQMYCFFHDRFASTLGILNGNYSDYMTEATFERVQRLVKAFEYEDVVEFIVTKPINAGNIVIGEIGSCTLYIDEKFNFLPMVEYKTRNENVKLFPHEVKPVNQAIMSEAVNDGYVHIENGNRFVPPLSLVKDIQALFGFEQVSRWEKVMENSRF